MKAIGYFKSKSLNETEALADLEISKPEASPLDLLVRVEAISVNPVDTRIRKNKSSENDTPVVLGWDVAGVVETIGSEVKNFKVGDEVIYAGSILRAGGNSQFHAVDHRIAALKPKSLSFEQAASLPLTALTAYEALFDQLGLDPRGRSEGKSILIIGGAGGVGSMAIQMGKIAGAKVIATASRPNTIAWAKKMGADVVLNHRESLSAQLTALGIGNVDTIFNTANTDQYWQEMSEIIRPFGKICSIVETTRPLDLSILMKKSATFSWELMFTRSMFETADISKQGEILSTVGTWIAEGKLASTLNESLSPINAKNLLKAHAALESGTTIGKIVLSGW